ncbi:hypothetical protein [Crossiella sp. NPDC003009]
MTETDRPMPKFAAQVAGWARRVRAWAGEYVAELVALAGGWQLADGAAELHPAAGPLTRGALLVAGAVCLVRARGR